MLLDFTLDFESVYRAINMLSTEKETVFVFRIDQNEFCLIGEKGRSSKIYLSIKTADMYKFTYYRTLEFEFNLKSLVEEVNPKVQTIQASGFKIRGFRFYMDSDQHLKFELKQD